VRVLPISDQQEAAAREVHRRLKDTGIRANLDAGNQTLNYRIREGEVHKVPYMAVVGQREAEAGTVAVRTRGAGSKQDILPVGEFVERLRADIASRALKP
jgi:threonyl-tRNA synthetase